MLHEASGMGGSAACLHIDAAWMPVQTDNFGIQPNLPSICSRLAASSLFPPSSVQQLHCDILCYERATYIASLPYQTLGSGWDGRVREGA
jgi:hypothetical protein